MNDRDYSQDDFPYQGIPADTRFKSAPLKHQEQAIEWMQFREEVVYEGIRGGMLLLDMGLGKTFITLAVCMLSGGPTLIVVPAQLVYVWKTEIEKHFHGLKYFLYHGTGRRQRLDQYRLQHGCDPQLLVVSFQGLRVDVDDVDGPLTYMTFHRIIFDECQYLKNCNSQTFHITERLRSSVTWFLSGTPIMNRIQEMYPFLKLLKYNGIRDIPKDSSSLGRSKSVPIRKYQLIQSILQTISMRRKKNILSLPQRTFLHLTMSFSPAEADFYEALKSYSKSRMQKLMNNLHLINRSTVPSDISNRLRLLVMQNMLSLIHNLRMVCCDPLIVVDKIPRTKYLSIERARNVLSSAHLDDCPVCYNDDVVMINHTCGHRVCTDCGAKLAKMKMCFQCMDTLTDDSFVRIHEAQDTKRTNLEDQKNHDERMTFCSRKTNGVMKYLTRELANGNKTIVVSQWTSYLDKLMREFRSRFPNIPFIQLDGRTTPKKRQALVDQFQQAPDDRVCFASLGSSAEGVTLTASCSMIIADVYWNMAKLNQISDRIHRIGQEQPVTIYCLYIRDSIELKLKELIEKKDAVCRVLVDGKAITASNEKWISKMISLLA